MSRIGLTPINLPVGVTVTVGTDRVTVKGTKAELFCALPSDIKVEVVENIVKVTRTKESLQSKANHGLIRSLINNMVEGVSKGFTKKLEMVGTGYRGKSTGTGLTLSAGYSHPVEFKAPAGITLAMEGETVIVVSGADKQMVGELAAKIRAVRPPEPYKGKGIKYQGEVIRRKAGKATKAGA